MKLTSKTNMKLMGIFAGGLIVGAVLYKKDIAGFNGRFSKFIDRLPV